MHVQTRYFRRPDGSVAVATRRSTLPDQPPPAAPADAVEIDEQTYQTELARVQDTIAANRERRQQEENELVHKTLADLLAAGVPRETAERLACYDPDLHGTA